MRVTEYLKEKRLLMDGAMGTQLHALGLRPGELPEEWNLLHPDRITTVHRAYVDAGCDVVTTNTFGANLLHYDKDKLGAVISAAVACAKAAASEAGRPVFVALDIGPSGRLLAPYGDLAFEDAVALFKATMRIGEDSGADLVLIETMTDSYETKAALLAAKEETRLPVFVSNTYDAGGRTLSGTPPEAMAAMLEGLGADAIGVNCSLGPEELLPVVREYLAHASVPVLCQPNAGLPAVIDGKAVYTVGPEAFADVMETMLREGLAIAGGCCGTTPDFIRELRARMDAVPFVRPAPRRKTVVSSRGKAVFFGKAPVLIGERINPTGKKRFKQALTENDLPYILNEGLRQAERGAHVLDVNVGLPGIDEATMLRSVVTELQAVTDLPLQPDTADPAAMEQALRAYNGKALINSVNGKEESMRTVFPLAKKYGGVLICLTLDETGIPDTAKGRLAVAKRILGRALDFGLHKEDLVFDPLTMAVSAMPDAALVTLESVRLIREELGCCVSLGVSNVSFGLPARDALNAAFFTMALRSGLSAAILNPDSAEMMKAYRCFLALTGGDDGFAGYLEAASGFTAAAAPAAAAAEARPAEEGGSPLQSAIRRGLVTDAASEAKRLLASSDPFDIIAGQIVPALDAVGKGFEEKRIFLPGLLMSAEAAKAAVEVVRSVLPSREENASGDSVVIATVRGDIHDIGKNIVKLLLENYGWRAVDLGKDVEPREIADAVKRTGSRLCALSALMTTTVPAMEETIRLLRKEAPDCRVLVGGAVLTADHARRIGADGYAPDAMGAVRAADRLRTHRTAFGADPDE